MSELSIRQEIINKMDFAPFDINEAVAPADVILAPANKNRYTTLPLNPGLPQRIAGHPRHWFALIPSDEVATGLTQVEFGFSSSEITGDGIMEPRFRHEFFVDQQIQLNYESNPLVKSLFRHIGGSAVRAVRNSGDKMFASLEVQFGKSDDRILQWAQLTYSKELLAAGSLLKRCLQQPYENYPPVFRNAILPKYRARTAAFLALSAFAAGREVY